MKYIAVGNSFDDGRVVIVFDGLATVELNESVARKLADDILRNANYMWPIEEEETK